MAVAAVDRVPPQNLEAEVAVLGSMLLDRDAIAAVVEILRPEDFYRESHRLIYTAITDLFERGEPCDLITVTDRLRDGGRLDDVGGAAYVSSLLNAVPTAANAEHYARIVLQKAMLRQLIRAGTQIAHMGFEGDEDVDALVDRAERLVFEIANRGMAQDFQAIRDIIKQTMERLDAGYERGMITGVPTGFVDLDELTGGLQPGDLIIVAARPSMGKCLKYDARIVDVRTGAVRLVEEVVRAQDASLLTLDPATARLREASASAFVDDGRRPVFRVRTALGRQVETTATHPFLTPDGWRPLVHLRPGHRVAVPARIPVFGTLDLPSHEVKLIAYLGAGRLPADPEVSRDFLDAVSAAAAVRAARVPALARYAAHAGGPDAVDETATARVLAEIAQDHPELESPAEHRCLPDAVYQLNRGKLCLLLNRLLACTASVEGSPSAGGAAGATLEAQDTLAVRAELPSAAMARQVQHLLLRLGVIAAWDGRTGLDVRGEAALQLLRGCGVLGWERLRQWARWAPQPLLPQSDVVWDMIVSIEPIGEHQVYDLTIPGTHNFVADDVCVHNTTLCLNMAQHAAIQHQTPVAIFSIETSAEQLVQRMLCAEAGVDGQRLRRGYLSESDWRKLTRAMGLLVEAPIYIDDSSNLSVIEMRAKSRKLKAEHGLGLIVIDYIQLIQSYKRTENRTQELSEIARGIKSLAKELHVPIVAVSQLSRAAEQGASKVPMLSHLRESGELEQVADLVIFLYREDYYDLEKARREGKENVALVRVAKHRNGPTDDIELFFHKEHSKFANLDRKHAGP
ncbi:MAG: replicative DNA helicase [Armatimonadota bacterium]|nr:replicative DNA helicase [Armatimonadota bacterium]MDR5696774.1 replicative DNA helicase [Armatimonadota bacterium]